MSHTSPPAAIVDPEKLAALKELAYGASHEINNPLANIAARAQTLLREEVDLERRRALEAIHAQAMRAHEMISDLIERGHAYTTDDGIYFDVQSVPDYGG